MTRRAFISYGAVDGDDVANLLGVVRWCHWLSSVVPRDQADDVTFTIYWSSYVSTAGDQVLEESLALIEGHTHVILVGHQTSKLMTQQQHAAGIGMSVIDLTSFGADAPAVGSTEAETLTKVLLTILNPPPFKGA